MKNVVQKVVESGLYTSLIGKRILFFQRIPSTMDQAIREAKSGTQNGTVIVTAGQTAGRGRFGREWVSSGGDLLLSIVLYPSLELMPFLSMIAAISVVRTIATTTSLIPTIKWPNDILIDGKKVAGLLIESASDINSVHYAVIGIGLNVALDADTVSDIDGLATSLDIESQVNNRLEILLGRLLYEFDDLYIDAINGTSPLEEWMKHMDSIGEKVTVRWLDKTVTGIVKGVDLNGHLILEQNDGVTLTLPTGEVTSRSQ